MPGLIDAHTHPIFAGNRAKEFAMKRAGVSYQEIAKQGGGIQYTAQCTKEASDKELLASTLKRLSTFLLHGVTTVEVKSGYGLSVEEELRHLKIIKQVKKLMPQCIKVTCLALHACPPDYKSSSKFVTEISNNLLPVVKEEKLADYVDAFVEQGYFSSKDVDPYLAKAEELELGVRLHADEFSDSKGAALAAKWAASSADHLVNISAHGIKSLAGSGTVAILLPGTSLYSNIPYAQAKPLIQANVPVALATDFNPGSCCFDNLAFIASIGSIHCGLTLAQTVAAVTRVPAASLGLQKTKGSLVKGYDADLLLYEGSSIKNIEEWLADVGKTPPNGIWIGGEKAVQQGTDSF
jgi:imidazolonepropionase